LTAEKGRPAGNEAANTITEITDSVAVHHDTSAPPVVSAGWSTAHSPAAKHRCWANVLCCPWCASGGVIDANLDLLAGVGTADCCDSWVWIFLAVKVIATSTWVDHAA